MLYAFGVLDTVTAIESKEKDGVIKQSFFVQIKGRIRDDAKACLIDVRIPAEHRPACVLLLNQIVILPVKIWSMDGSKSGVSPYDASNPVPQLFNEYLKNLMQKQK